MTHAELVRLQRALLRSLSFYCNDFWVPCIPGRLLADTRIGRALRVIDRARRARGRTGGRDGPADGFRGGMITRRSMAVYIADGYRILAEAIDRRDPTERGEDEAVVGSVDELVVDDSDPREHWIGELARDAEAGWGRFAKGVYLHGSVATRDHCAYSDCDTLVILREATVLDADRLRAFRSHCYRSTRFLYLFDPYQHHGHMLCTEIDQGFYPASFLPIETLRLARRITGDVPGCFVLRRDEHDRRAAVRDIGRAIIGARRDGRFRTNKYHVKLLCSWVMLLPVLMLQRRHHDLYKREALARARYELEEWQWRPVARASAVRQAWRLDASEIPTRIEAGIARLEPSLWRRARRFGRSVRGTELEELVTESFVEGATAVARQAVEDAAGEAR